MSDARVEYEAAVDSATAALAGDCAKAYQHMRAVVDTAWYTYCVRTGMVTVPPDERTGETDGDRSEAVEVDHGQPGRSDSEPAASPDGPADAGQGTETSGDNGTADEGTAPDYR